VILTLSFPPSLNRLYRNVQGKTLISREGREYRQTVGWECRAANAPTFQRRPVRLHIVAFMPDARRRDLDNLMKATLDALQHAQVFADDSQVRDLRIQHGGIDRHRPRLEVSVEAA
jgi:crossover junction endodeoxyribonuclease RusA